MSIYPMYALSGANSPGHSSARLIPPYGVPRTCYNYAYGGIATALSNAVIKNFSVNRGSCMSCIPQSIGKTLCGRGRKNFFFFSYSRGLNRCFKLIKKTSSYSFNT
ncbi:Piso0_000390 [Millerozyma farinosa CBS 7064]|uniref:Piso0_000390 protein n=1 Tax=Pichia sorbitophila (strain ATCC MYA-4447 / BCRC 22081 / CBS 7064 / NBRC 10061 / NRRL Y-12695) TaxID=559304 RepID=G8YVB3_PICSO|nr:Piso0_000390 [Millerozyma farinosa CBS 7064]CCE73357.1 Piso0_000390 [Millerozyma farinosa CBS 7064]